MDRFFSIFTIAKRLVLSVRRFATDSTTSTAKQTDNAIKLKSLDYIGCERWDRIKMMRKSIVIFFIFFCLFPLSGQAAE
ncbi:MAG: hypothetical protein ACRCWR_10480, partial [Saezia sp.]